tara:strand:- start:1015 stop:1350 length:336 start_codon:yes stop_codon:yes gene_type:complete
MAKRKRPVPRHLKKIEQDELNLIIKDHTLYVKTKGRRGNAAVFDGIDFTGCSFRNAWLNDIDFSGCWLQDCDFNFSRLSGCNFEDCWVEGSTSHGVDFTNVNIKGTLWDED